MKRTLLAAVFVLAAGAAQAQDTYHTTPLGNGFSITTGPDGYSATTIPLGNGFSTTTDNHGTNLFTTPQGNGFYTTTVTPGSGYSQRVR